MTNLSLKAAGLGAEAGLSAEAAGDDWVLALSLVELGRVVPGSVRWAERGHLRGFFHGELFNRDTLTGDAPPDCSDVDIVLNTYEQVGESALARLRGSFVVAIIDRLRDIAILARDPLGSHPLFYAEVGSCVLFAAVPQRLLAQPGVSRELNRLALADHLCHRWSDRGETFFAAVRRVPPACKAIISRGRLRLSRYWDPVPEDQPIQWLTEQEATQFAEVFDRAVDRCLRNSGSTGIFLSGGLDSISVAAAVADRARQIGKAPPVALSLEFPDPSCNERTRQAAVARELGLRQHFMTFHEALGSRPLLEQALQRNQEIATPPLNPWQPAYLKLAKWARLNGVRSILTGQGGDEWLGVTPYLAADLIRRGALIELMEFFSTLRRSYTLPLIAQARHTFWTCGLRPLGALALHGLMPRAHEASRIRRMLRRDPIWVAPDPELRAAQKARAHGSLTRPDPPQGFYMRDLWASIDHSLASWESEEQFAMGKQIGVRFVHPFRDPDLVEMLCRIPPRILNKGGRTKGLVRGTLTQRFPVLGLGQQRKVSAKAFFESLLVREGPVLADRAGDFPALSALGVVDGRATRAFVSQELKQPSRRFQRILEPLKLEIWSRSHGA